MLDRRWQQSDLISFRSHMQFTLARMQNFLMLLTIAQNANDW